MNYTFKAIPIFEAAKLCLRCLPGFFLAVVQPPGGSGARRPQKILRPFVWELVNFRGRGKNNDNPPEGGEWVVGQAGRGPGGPPGTPGVDKKKPGAYLSTIRKLQVYRKITSKSYLKV